MKLTIRLDVELPDDFLPFVLRSALATAVETQMGNILHVQLEVPVSPNIPAVQVIHMSVRDSNARLG